MEGVENVQIEARKAVEEGVYWLHSFSEPILRKQLELFANDWCAGLRKCGNSGRTRSL